MATDTVDFEKTLQAIGFGDGWTWDKGSWWLVSPEQTVPAQRIAAPPFFRGVAMTNAQSSQIRARCSSKKNPPHYLIWLPAPCLP